MLIYNKMYLNVFNTINYYECLYFHKLEMYVVFKLFCLI